MYRSRASLNVAFPQIDWASLQSVYGWAALQWQAWARGEIIVQSERPKTLALYTPGILEFWIGGEHYFGGDFYGYERAAVTLHLEPGVHSIDIRIVRDIRSMGAVGEPTVNANLELYTSSGALEPVLRLHTPVLISDFVGNDDEAILASSYISVSVRNDALDDIFVYAIEASRDVCLSELVSKIPIKVVPGQTRPIAARLACITPIGKAPLYGQIIIQFKYQMEGHNQNRTVSYSAYPRLRNVLEPHKFTYMHPGGIVSYAILRPPNPNSTHALDNKKPLPILLGLHGADVEADDDAVKHSLDPVPDLAAWVLFPAGVTPWSGDDWHTWGFADVEGAIAAIPTWIERVGWEGPGVDIDRWLVSGHSNGGQGVWYALTHRPDKIIAAAALSGYPSIQNYVPYTFWQSADPGRTAIVQGALNNYRNELLLPNVKGIPIFQQHGGGDDNVPPYNSRMLSQMIGEAGAESDYFEFPGKPHWWAGVMTTDPLKEFYNQHLRANVSKPPFTLRDFSLVVADARDMGPKRGLKILQLRVPGQLGKIEVSFDAFTRSCVLRTSNVIGLSIPQFLWECESIQIDDQAIYVPATHSLSSQIVLLHGRWQTEDNSRFQLPFTPALTDQPGTMDAILGTPGTLSIVAHSVAAKRIALQISRNFCQYLAADTEITANFEDALHGPGNAISVAIAEDLPPSLWDDLPIRIEKNRVWIRRPDETRVSYSDAPGFGLAAIFIRPLGRDRFEIVVWGADEESLEVAARLVPMMTGTGQPDFIILDRRMLWKGVAGTLSLGFYGQLWTISASSYFS